MSNRRLMMRCLMIVFALVLLSACALEAQETGRWVSNGPYGHPQGPVIFDYAKSNLMYSGSGVLFRSTDAGISWNLLKLPAGLGISLDIFRTHPKLPGVIFGVGEVPPKLYFFSSTDEGSTWKRIFSGSLPVASPDTAQLRDLQFDPTNPEI